MTADMPLSDYDLINLSGYSFSISARRSSFDFPSRCCRRPRSSSSFPSVNERSLSVSWPYFCFNFPFTSFQLPFTCNFDVIAKGLRRSLGAWSRDQFKKCSHQQRNPVHLSYPLLVDRARSPSQDKCRRTTSFKPKGVIAFSRMCAIASSTESVTKIKSRSDRLIIPSPAIFSNSRSKSRQYSVPITTTGKFLILPV